ncbi:hypothetical protein BH09PAT2_BH09PAT2_00300 [soil metagenome]
MKLLNTFIAGSILLYIGMFAINGHVQAILMENPDRPVIDDGTGNGSYGNGFHSTKTLEKIVNILMGTVGGIPNTTHPPGSSPTPSGPTPTSDPNSSPTPTPDPNNNTANELGLKPNYNYPQDYVDAVQGCLINRPLYNDVQSYTGVPWQVIAGIHFLEGICGQAKSCVSGRAIGANEPDIRGNCTAADSGLGKPNPLAGGGCGFTNLLDSCVYGANHLIGKIGKAPSNLQELAKALGRYNGTGNANCGKTPFTGCPAQFEGYDHIYPFSKFDDTHQNMYLVYCADGVVCNPPRPFTRIGVLTVASILSR